MIASLAELIDPAGGQPRAGVLLIERVGETGGAQELHASVSSARLEQASELRRIVDSEVHAVGEDGEAWPALRLAGAHGRRVEDADGPKHLAAHHVPEVRLGPLALLE